MQRIAVLGSTGSIGQNSLEVIKNFPEEFRVIGLSANSNIDILYRQIKSHRPGLVCVKEPQAALKLKSRLDLKNIKLFMGQEGLDEMVQDKHIDKIVLAISGSGALSPLLKAIDSCKDIALANKEALVMAGPIIMDRAAKKKIKIIPVDSEQSAIWQCLNGQDKNKLNNIYLTASGGPLRRSRKRELKNVSVSRVLNHPRWKMGKKISVDSATLMNKGLEVLETMHLFNVPPEKIKIIIHPEAIIHSMVEFVDGVILAQLSDTDMRIPIQYALSYPARLSSRARSIDFYKLKGLNFQKPDFKKFPCFGLAYMAAYEGGTLPTVLNATNEVSVDEFLKGRLNFASIPKIINRVLDKHHKKNNPDLEEILKADDWARKEAHKIIENLN
ncbi:MAG: 1-deoxy-D-xylulose-5-phosphate reductoisomerase [Candidatus Omnitrophica bacterium]|nr:1-deoxy-D-xylulose-5-phosphate reductoisomerase [Candidatus Omnitrophota bacterium]